MQIKTTMRCRYTPSRIAEALKSLRRGSGMTGAFRVLTGMQIGATTLETKLAISFKVKHTMIILVTVSSLSIGTRQMKLCLQRPVH